MLNGPIRKEIDLNCSNNLFGPGKMTNATIGRAIRLIQLNIGGVVPGVTDKSCHGWPGKYTLCWGENEEASPWVPYHVEKGFNPNDSTLTIFAAGSLWRICDRLPNKFTMTVYRRRESENIFLPTGVAALKKTIIRTAVKN